jgi:SulP family sulfate permease
LFEDEQPLLPPAVSIYEISGVLYFGAAQTCQDTLSRLQNNPKVLILRMRNVPFIDATGIYRLKEMIRQFEKQKVDILLSGVTTQVKDALEKADIYSVLSRDNVVDNIDASLIRANAILVRRTTGSQEHT